MILSAVSVLQRIQHHQQCFVQVLVNSRSYFSSRHPNKILEIIIRPLMTDPSLLGDSGAQEDFNAGLMKWTSEIEFGNGNSHDVIHYTAAIMSRSCWRSLDPLQGGCLGQKSTEKFNKNKQQYLQAYIKYLDNLDATTLRKLLHQVVLDLCQNIASDKTSSSFRNEVDKTQGKLLVSFPCATLTVASIYTAPNSHMWSAHTILFQSCEIDQQ